MNTQSARPKATGWIAFAGVLLLIAGVLNVVDGIAALSEDERYEVAELLFGSLTTWGVIYLITGVVQLLAAGLLFKSKMTGMVLAVSIAALSGIAHFLSIGAYPIWSVTVMFINFMIIFGLLTHDNAFE